jgi:hypothetical protein
MVKLLDGYRIALRSAHPLRLGDADRTARWIIYRTLYHKYGSNRFFLHFKAIMAVLDKAYSEEA